MWYLGFHQSHTCETGTCKQSSAPPSCSKGRHGRLQRQGSARAVQGKLVKFLGAAAPLFQLTRHSSRASSALFLIPISPFFFPTGCDLREAIITWLFSLFFYSGRFGHASLIVSSYLIIDTFL